MIIESTAPPRVDLAGGTIDIWPLYLFHPGATTVNFALSLYARCRIETRDDERIILESRDREVSFETNLSALEDLLTEERLELVSKLIHFFKPTTGFHLTVESNVPAGAGLGGSSALAIACIGALNTLVGKRYDAEFFLAEIRAHGSHACNYLLTVDMEMDPSGQRRTARTGGRSLPTAHT